MVVSSFCNSLSILLFLSSPLEEKQLHKLSVGNNLPMSKAWSGLYGFDQQWIAYKKAGNPEIWVLILILL